MRTTEVTGRDTYIVFQALQLAIKWMDAQQVKDKKLLSDRADMEELLDAYYPFMGRTGQLQQDIANALDHGFEFKEGQRLNGNELRNFVIKKRSVRAPE